MLSQHFHAGIDVCLHFVVRCPFTAVKLFVDPAERIEKCFDCRTDRGNGFTVESFFLGQAWQYIQHVPDLMQRVVSGIDVVVREGRCNRFVHLFKLRDRLGVGLGMLVVSMPVGFQFVDRNRRPFGVHVAFATTDKGESCGSENRDWQQRQPAMTEKT